MKKELALRDYLYVGGLIVAMTTAWATNVSNVTAMEAKIVSESQLKQLQIDRNKLDICEIKNDTKEIKNMVTEILVKLGNKR